MSLLWTLSAPSEGATFFCRGPVRFDPLQFFALARARSFWFWCHLPTSWITTFVWAFLISFSCTCNKCVLMSWCRVCWWRCAFLDCSNCTAKSCAFSIILSFVVSSSWYACSCVAVRYGLILSVKLFNDDLIPQSFFILGQKSACSIVSFLSVHLSQLPFSLFQNMYYYFLAT